MSANSSIQWTDATWNPTRGCSIVSPGCTHCYAMKQAHRFSGPGGKYEGLTMLTKGGPVWTGKVIAPLEALEIPLDWKKPRRIFVNSMSDLFHESLPTETIEEIFAVMAGCPQHTFQVLTKRPERMLEWFKHAHVLRGTVSQWPLPNVWLGVSCEDQKRFDERVSILGEVHWLWGGENAPTVFLSCEPLLGPIDLGHWVPDYPTCSPSWTPADCRSFIDWIIVGGESGPGARPCDPRWVFDLINQCRAGLVPCFVKQLGRQWALERGEALEFPETVKDLHGGTMEEWPAALRVREFPA